MKELYLYRDQILEAVGGSLSVAAGQHHVEIDGEPFTVQVTDGVSRNIPARGWMTPDSRSHHTKSIPDPEPGSWREIMWWRGHDPRPPARYDKFGLVYQKLGPAETPA